DGAGDVDAVEGEAAAPARGGHDQQAVLCAGIEVQLMVSHGVEVGDLERLRLERGEGEDQQAGVVHAGQDAHVGADQGSVKRILNILHQIGDGGVGVGAAAG